jgi:hypothetical protein
VEEILKNPDKLRDLDLDAFAEELERQDYGNKRTTLYDIRNELFEPFKERRSPYTPINQVRRMNITVCIYVLDSSRPNPSAITYLDLSHSGLVLLSQPLLQVDTRRPWA